MYCSKLPWALLPIEVSLSPSIGGILGIMGSTAWTTPSQPRDEKRTHENFILRTLWIANYSIGELDIQDPKTTRDEQTKYYLMGIPILADSLPTQASRSRQA